MGIVSEFFLVYNGFGSQAFKHQIVANIFL